MKFKVKVNPMNNVKIKLGLMKPKLTKPFNKTQYLWVLLNGLMVCSPAVFSETAGAINGATTTPQSSAAVIVTDPGLSTPNVDAANAVAPTVAEPTAVTPTTEPVPTPPVAAPVLVVAPAPVAAPTQPYSVGFDKINSGDTAWMLSATALVLLMTIPGLVLFYAGMVRKKKCAFNRLAKLCHLLLSECNLGCHWL